MGFNQPQLRTEPRESLEHLALGQTDYDPTALNMPNTTVASGLVEPIPQPEQPQEQGFMSKVGDYLGNIITEPYEIVVAPTTNDGRIDASRINLTYLGGI